MSHKLPKPHFFPPDNDVETSSNVGGFGIDGCVSTLIGASLADPSALHICVTGDLAFFYDMNSLGNRHVGSNVRILLVNNNVGMTFKHTNHFAHTFGHEADEFIAAGGHNVNRFDSYRPGASSPAKASNPQGVRKKDGQGQALSCNGGFD